MTPFTTLLIGNESLAIQCGEAMLARGHKIAAVVTHNPDVQNWATGKGLRVEVQDAGYAARLSGLSVDWLLSVANLHLIPDAVLALAGKGAVNFHDGPLPRYAGLNAPVWAILNGEAQHGITWHLITSGVDEGDILEQRLFDIAANETALTLNTKCFEAAIDSFPALLMALESGQPTRTPQDFAKRSLHTRADRPNGAGWLDFTQTPEQVVRFVHALDHGSYFNPLVCAKMRYGDRFLLVKSAEVAAGSGTPGTVLAADADGMTVACGTGALRLSGLTCQRGLPATPPQPGEVLTLPTPADLAEIDTLLARIVPGEPALRRALTTLDPAEIEAGPMTNPVWASLPLSETTLAKLALAAARLSGKAVCDLAYRDADAPCHALLSDWVPLRASANGTVAEALAKTDAALARAHKYPAFLLDLRARDAALTTLQTPPIGLAAVDPIPRTAITLTPSALHYDSARIPAEQARAYAARLTQAVQAMMPEADAATLPILPPEEREQVLHGWNATETSYDQTQCVHQAFEAQVTKTPDAIALSFESHSLTYAQLNARANRAAHVLIEMGVKPGTLVGLCTHRSLDLLIGALAIQKAGGAYVPMDPAYPADRIALYIEDSAAPVIVTQSALEDTLPPHSAQTLALDTDPRLAQAPDTNPDVWRDLGGPCLHDLYLWIDRAAQGGDG